LDVNSWEVRPTVSGQVRKSHATDPHAQVALRELLKKLRRANLLSIRGVADVLPLSVAEHVRVIAIVMQTAPMASHAFRGMVAQGCLVAHLEARETSITTTIAINR